MQLSMSKKNRMFYRFYILKGDRKSPTIYDTFDEWNIVCKSFPYSFIGEAKDLPTNDWPDEDGLEVYVPKEGGLRLKPQTIEIEFVCCDMDARMRLKEFSSFITGRDGTDVMFGVYDSYTGLAGYGAVYQKHKPDIYYRRKGTKEIVVFSMEFLFTEPLRMDMIIHPANGSFNDDFNDDFHREYVY